MFYLYPQPNSEYPRELPKKATNVAFTADAQTLLVSDKFGDIFR